MSQEHPHFGLNCQMVSFSSGFLAISLQFRFPSVIGRSTNWNKNSKSTMFTRRTKSISGSNWNIGPGIAHITWIKIKFNARYSPNVARVWLVLAKDLFLVIKFELEEKFALLLFGPMNKILKIFYVLLSTFSSGIPIISVRWEAKKIYILLKMIAFCYVAFSM